MNIERVRSILGVWAPMAIGLFIIVTSILEHDRDPHDEFDEA